MWKTVKKLYSFVLGVITTIVAVFSFKEILKTESLSLRTLLFLVLCVTFPILIYCVVSIFKKKNNDFEINGIRMVTLDYEYGIHEELLRKTKDICIESVDYIYEFVGRDFTSIRTYKGRCISRIKKVLGFPLVVAGDSNALFDELNCFAYDLLGDPDKNRIIKPKLIDSEGVYKFARYNFANPLEYNQKFSIETHYTWPNCVRADRDYILVSPIFYSRDFESFKVELRFFQNQIPLRVEKYLVVRNRKPEFIREIAMCSTQPNPGSYITYIDEDVEMPDDIAFFVYTYDFK